MQPVIPLSHPHTKHGGHIMDYITRPFNQSENRATSHPTKPTNQINHPNQSASECNNTTGKPNSRSIHTSINQPIKQQTVIKTPPNNLSTTHSQNRANNQSRSKPTNRSTLPLREPTINPSMCKSIVHTI